MLYDAVVVGAGPAGLSAGLWLARHRRRVLVLDRGEPRNRWADLSHGYLTQDRADPGHMLQLGRAELQAYEYAELRPGTVATLAGNSDEGFTVAFDDSEVQARRLVLATGVADAFPDIAGFEDHYGSSVFHCPTCDGYEARDRPIAVFGWSVEVSGFAMELLDWAARVTVVTDGRPFEGDATHREALARHGVEVIEDDAIELIGERGDLHAVRLRRGGDLECSMAFFTIEHRPVVDLARRIGCRLTEEGCVDADADGLTSVPGVYAAGDVTPGLQLVQIAAAKGALAGIACARSLRGELGSPTSPAPGPDPDEELPS